MSGTVSEWIGKAQADYDTASREMQVSTNPNYDAVCFHCQQCIEKLSKAALKNVGVEPPYVHDIFYLLKLLREAGTVISFIEEEVRLLTQSAVVFRYPGESASKKDAVQVMDICKRLRGDLMIVLGETMF